MTYSFLYRYQDIIILANLKAVIAVVLRAPTIDVTGRITMMKMLLYCIDNRSSKSFVRILD